MQLLTRPGPYFLSNVCPCRVQHFLFPCRPTYMGLHQGKYFACSPLGFQNHQMSHVRMMNLSARFCGNDQCQCSEAYPGDLGSHKGSATRRRLPMMVAGLQGHICCCAFCRLTSTSERIHLSMRLASLRMIPLSNDLG